MRRRTLTSATNSLLFSLSPAGAVLLLLFSFATAAHADTLDYVKAYHPVINQAELKVVDGQYEDALRAYQQAFAAVPSPFARDYYNAAVCATLLGEERQARKYLEQLALKGVSLAYLERQEAFDALQSTRHWRKFKRKYPKRRRTFEQTANLDLRADLDELYARDQYFRQAEGGLRAYRDTLKQIEDSNVKLLLSWIEAHGYPGEGLIGVADTLEQLPRYSIVIRRQTKARKGYDFTAILTQAVHQGNIDPQAAAYLLDQQAGQNKYGSRAFVTINCTKCKKEAEQEKILAGYLEEKRSAEELERVNQRREALGLEPLEDYKRKIRYALQDDRFKLGYTWSVTTYQVPSKEAAEVLMEKLTGAE